MSKHFGFVLACSAAFCISSCGTTYFVDPVSTPVFTAPGQGDVQVSFDSHGKFFFEGAYALPHDYAVVLTRENYSQGLDKDQCMTSFALGHFWPNADSTSAFQVFAGFEAGSHRIGPNAYFTPNPGSFARAPLAYTSTDARSDSTATYSASEWYLTGKSDFRKYCIQGQWALRGPSGTFGVAMRLYYLDQYNFYLASQGIVGAHNADTSITIDNAPKNGTSLDIAVFGSIPISFIELYGMIQVSTPPSGHFFPHGEKTSLDGPSDPRNWDEGALAVGIKVNF